MKKPAVKETIAAVGVILSLLFVAFEVRQNASAVRSATIQGIAGQSFKYSLALVQDLNWLRIMESRFRQMQLGVIDSGDIRNLGGTSNQNWYGSHFFKEWWVLSDPPSRWAPDFVRFMEQDVMQLGR